LDPSFWGLGFAVWEFRHLSSKTFRVPFLSVIFPYTTMAASVARVFARRVSFFSPFFSLYSPRLARFPCLCA